MAHDAFISYSSQDKATADAACATLEARGIRCWIAPRDVLPGANWAAAISEAIRQSRVFLLIFSADANGSQQVTREVERAVAAAIPIIPFRIENVIPSDAMEYFLGSHHWLDAMTPPMQRHLERLADTVHVLVQQSGTTAAARSTPASPLPASPPALGAKADSGRLLPLLKRYRWIAAGAGAGLLALLVMAAVLASHGRARGSEGSGPHGPGLTRTVASEAAASAPCAGWIGSFSTLYGLMGPLTKSGDTVSGTYAYKQGRISGTVSGQVFSGTWSQAPSYKPPNDAGDVQLTLAPDGSFGGRWRNGSAGDWHSNWNGICLGQTDPGIFTGCAAAPAASAGPSAPSRGSLTIKAYIDGRSDLVLCGASAHWHHFDAAAPGLWPCQNGQPPLPTTINGKDFLPSWPNAGSGCSHRDCGCDSSAMSGIDTPIATGVSLSNVKLQAVDCRDSCNIAQAGSGQVVIDFNDDPSPLAAWYTVVLCFGSGPCGSPASPSP